MVSQAEVETGWARVLPPSSVPLSAPLAAAPPRAMDFRRLRLSEQIPSAPAADARCLHGLPSSWSRPIAESAVDSLMKRADAVGRTLLLRGDVRGAASLRRTTELLRRADALCTHAVCVETLVQIYRALVTLHADLAAEEPGDRVEEAESPAWLQAGALATDPTSTAHGPAVRETTALRNRAFRSLEAAIARHTREAH
jgi:hypothetical protein